MQPANKHNPTALAASLVVISVAILATAQPSRAAEGSPAANAPAAANSCRSFTREIGMVDNSKHGMIYLSEDRSRILTNDDNNATLFDVATGAETKFDKGTGQQAVFLRDGRIALPSNIADWVSRRSSSGSGKKGAEPRKPVEPKLTIVDPATGARAEMPGYVVYDGRPYRLISADMGGNHHHGEYVIADGTGAVEHFSTKEILLGLRGETVSPVRIKGWTGGHYSNSQGEFPGEIKATLPDGQTRRYFLQTPKLTQLESSGSTPDGRFSWALVTDATDKDESGKRKSLLAIMNHQTGDVVTGSVPQGFTPLAEEPRFGGASLSAPRQPISPDGSRVLLEGDKGKIFAWDTATGETHPLPFGGKDIRTAAAFDKHGRICGQTEASKGSADYICVDGNSLREISRQPMPPLSKGANVIPLGNDRFLLANENGVRVIAAGKLCPPVVAHEGACKPEAGAPADVEPLRRLAGAARCQSDYSPSLWPQEAPHDRELSESESLEWLMKFSKPGGFSTSQDAGVLEALLKQGYDKRYPGETRAALLGVASFSPWLYASYARSYPAITAIPAAAPLRACASETERHRMEKSLRTWTQELIHANSDAPLATAETLAPIAKLVMTKSNLEEMADHMGTSLAEKAEDSWGHLVPTGKAQALGTAASRAKLGLEQPAIQDVRLARKADLIQPVVVSTAKLPSGAETGSGFSVRQEKIIPFSELPEGGSASRDLKWESDGRKYRASIEIERPAVSGPIARTEAAPDYKAMWRDNRFHSIMLLGANIEDELLVKTLQEYRDYFQKEGFKFGERTVVSDTPAYLKERASGKEQANFLIKEAHADDDEDNVLEVSLKSQVLRGERKVGGKTEIIELVSPISPETGKQPENRRIPNSDFADWMKARAEAGGKPFVYFNSSCWSAKSKAITEISETANPLFVDLPFITMADSFENKRENIMRAVVDGIRKGKTYAQIREALKADREYADGSQNQVVFPDEERYKSVVLSGAVPLKVKTRIFETGADGREKPYTPPYDVR